jgi:hypothetical protein
MKYPTAQALAEAFTNEVDARLESPAIADVIAGGSVINDHCDGNELLLTAWQAATGEACEFAASDERMVALMNEAQAIAKASAYEVEDPVGAALRA